MSPPKTQALGLRWWRIGFKKPANREEFLHAALSRALETKHCFTPAEFEALGVNGLKAHHVVRASGTFFQPTPTKEASWRTLSPSAETKEQIQRNRTVSKRMNSQFDLGLVERLLVEQKREEVQRAASEAVLMQRRNEAKAALSEGKVAAIQKAKMLRRQQSAQQLTVPPK